MTGDLAGLPTIAALATPLGRSGIAIIRISGPTTSQVLTKLTGRVPPPPRQATLCKLKNPGTDEVLDEALILWFPAPASYTGEAMAELHVHGGPAVIEGIMAALLGECDVKMAEPGAFSRRAFDNGKLDLTEIEAVADLIAAETSAQRQQATRQLSGALGRKAEAWRTGLIEACAYLEAAIDFPDEDLPEETFKRAAPLLQAILDEMSATLADGAVGERLRDGLVVAIIGPPNVGKSSLLNALAKRDVAIVSEYAGTTRDVLEVALSLGGLPVVLVDTAGLRDADNPVEREGVKRALERAGSADLRLILEDVTAEKQASEFYIAPQQDDIRVATKFDLNAQKNDADVCISAKTGLGLPELIQAIQARASALMTAETAPILTRQRHRQELTGAVEALGAALAGNPAFPELMAEDVRRACAALGRITGRIDVEDVLDAIFSSFCIGK